MFRGLGLVVQGLGFRVQVEGLGYKVEGEQFRVFCSMEQEHCFVQCPRNAEEVDKSDSRSRLGFLCCCARGPDKEKSCRE